MRSPPPTSPGCRSRATVIAEPAGGRLGDGAGYLMDHVAGTSVAPRVLRRDELETARERLPGQLAARARPDPLGRRGGGRGPRRWRGPRARSVRALGGGARRDRRAAARGRGWAAVAAPQRAAARRAAARPRRLPARQPDRRRARARRGDRLGAMPRGRPGRGSRLADDPLVAVRQRRSPGRRARRAGAVPGRLRGRRGDAARSRPDALVGGACQRQVGRDLRPPGARSPDRRAALGRAGVAGTPDLRARMGPAGADPA